MKNAAMKTLASLVLVAALTFGFFPGLTPAASALSADDSAATIKRSSVETLVSTGPVVNITLQGAKFTGSILSSDGAKVTERGFLISTYDDPVLDGLGVIALFAGRGTGEFSIAVDSLMPGKTYYVRAYAINEAGVSYGMTLPFVAGSMGGANSLVPNTGGDGSPIGIVVAAAGALCGCLALARRRKGA